jgi:hypothetical protein
MPHWQVRGLVLLVKTGQSPQRARFEMLEKIFATPYNINQA